MAEHENIIERYKAGESATQISKDTGYASSSIYRILKKAGVKTRGLSESHKEHFRRLRATERGDKRKPLSKAHRENLSKSLLKYADSHARGTMIRPDGYVWFTRGPNAQRAVHVVIMEERIGRRLRNDECVHHIDGVRTNNNEDNLALVTWSGHTRLHMHEERLAGIKRKRTPKARAALALLDDNGGGE